MAVELAEYLNKFLEVIDELEGWEPVELNEMGSGWSFIAQKDDLRLYLRIGGWGMKERIEAAVGILNEEDHWVTVGHEIGFNRDKEVRLIVRDIKRRLFETVDAVLGERRESIKKARVHKAKRFQTEQLLLEAGARKFNHNSGFLDFHTNDIGGVYCREARVGYNGETIDLNLSHIPKKKALQIIDILKGE